MHEEVLEDRVQIALGSLDDPGIVQPEDHVWTRSQLHWFEIQDDLPRFTKSSTAVVSRAEED
jgi:hypothetical protein